MRTVVQRVSKASVSIQHGEKREIGPGLLVFLGIEESDEQGDADWLCSRIARLRIFSDAGGLMNCSLEETGGEVMLISQFTLHASTRKGNRPSFIRAARPETAIPLYEYFISRLSELCSKPIVTGDFGAHMEVELINDGPVTLLIDSKVKE